MAASIDSIRESIQCSICMEVATLPVHPTCCENGASLAPACLSCVRSYLELNKRPSERDYHKKSWNGCGCNINPQNGSKAYRHTKQLDTIRNLLGPSICHHEECRAEFETCAELRRHLTGNSTAGDPHGNCQYATTKCKHCHYFGVRHDVEGPHYRQYHASVRCRLCGKDVRLVHAEGHYIDHKKNLENQFKSLDDLRIELEDLKIM